MDYKLLFIALMMLAAGIMLMLVHSLLLPIGIMLAIAGAAMIFVASPLFCKESDNNRK